MSQARVVRKLVSFVVLGAAVLVTGAGSAEAAIPAAERAALIALYNSTNGPGWTDSTNWLGPEGTECTWYGVYCDATPRVRVIQRSGKNLVGTLPASLANLSNLQELSLAQNQLRGGIPLELGSLASLRILRLESNQLSGTIPTELGALTNLQILDLAVNDVTGVIPPQLGALPNLQWLSLTSNQLSGTIPVELASLTNLQLLLLSSNQLTGTIPTGLGNPALQFLHLGRNQLTGSIPTSLGSATNLAELDLGGNQLSGTIPAGLGNLASARFLSLSNNQLSGTIPPELGSLASVRFLSLDRNQLSGSIPPSFGNLTRLESLSLNSNQLSGSIPPEFGNLTTLGALFLGKNLLSGGIPPALGNLANLRFLDLTSNQLSGSIPPQFGNLTSLEDLYLDSNQLSGSIPPELGNLPNLGSLELRSNRLTGNVPETLGNLTQLMSLKLGSNQLTGNLPLALTNLTNLRVALLELSWNSLYTDNAALMAFIDSKAGVNWTTTQTIRPTGVTAVGAGTDSVDLAWAPIPYKGDTGGYRVRSATVSGGPYELAGQTADKSATGMHVAGLAPYTTYYFVVETVTDPHVNNQNTVVSERTPEVSTTTPPDPGVALFVDIGSIDNGSGQIVVTPAGGTCANSPGGINQCQYPYVIGTEVTLRAIPAADSVFLGWEGVCASAGTGPCTYTVTDTNVAMVAFRGPQRVMVAVGSPDNGSGQVIVTPTGGTCESTPGQPQFCEYMFRIGTQITLTPMPAPDSIFIGWEPFGVCAAAGTGPCTFTVSESTFTGVTFQGPQPLYVSIGALDNGSGQILVTPPGTACENSPGDGGTRCEYALRVGAQVTLTPIPAPDSLFVGWEPFGPCATAGIGPCMYTVTGPESVWASFKLAPLTCAEVSEIPPAECAALETLYGSTNGPTWIDSTNWFASATPSNWYGVTVTDGHVTGLVLGWNGLQGTIPGELGNLVNLQTLILSSNQLSGSIPPSLGGLTELTSLFLDNNQLSGSIPAELGRLTNVYDFFLNSNQLSGSIPPSLGGLVQVQSLVFEYNQLTGSIPDELGNLSNLMWLYLNSNQLSGSIPAAFGNLSNLVEVRLNSNQLTGSIPAELGNLPSLKYVFFASNQLSGSIPASLGSLRNLTDLRLESNRLSGSIPAELGSLSNLWVLRLHENELTGSIPSELGNLAMLSEMNLSSNRLSGSIPDALGAPNLPRLADLFLNSNQLSGAIPASLTKRYIRVLSLSSNQLSGSIPAGFTHCDELLLDSNRLSGSIPPDLGNDAYRTRLNLRSNQLTGSVPSTFTNLKRLTAGRLDLRWNGLYTSDAALRAFLNGRQIGGNWEGTQTIAPKNLAVATAGAHSVDLTLTPIAYTGDAGAYRVYGATVPGGPYALAGQTADKSATSVTATGLLPGTAYYFVVDAVTSPHANNQNSVASERTTEVSATTAPAPEATISVNVVSMESGAGQVVVTPGGTCAGSPGANHTCPYTYEIGAVVTLTATPSPDSIFLGWEGACAPAGTRPCTLTITEPAFVSAMFQAVPRADLSISIVDTPDPVVPSATISYAVTVTNSGPGDAASVVLTDTLPASVTGISAIGPCSVAAQTVTCTWASIAASTSEVVTINVTAPAAAGEITSHAHVESATADPNAANNDVSETTTVFTTKAGNELPFLTATSREGVNVIEWQNPVAGPYQATLVRVRDVATFTDCDTADGFPVDPTDGNKVTSQPGAGIGQHDRFEHTGLLSERTYCYSAFVYKGNGEYSLARHVKARPIPAGSAVAWGYSTGASALASTGLGTCLYAVSNDNVLHGMTRGEAGGEWPSGWTPFRMRGPALHGPEALTYAVGSATSVIYLASTDGSLYAVDAASGAGLWTSAVDYGMLLGAPAAWETRGGATVDYLLFGTRNAGAGNRLVALDPLTGVEPGPWGSAQPVGHIGIVVGVPAVDYVRGWAYFTTRERAPGRPTVWCVRLSDGGIEWSLALGNVSTSPILRGETLYVGTSAGLVHALDVTNGGNSLWSYPTADGPIKRRLSIGLTDTHVYFSTNSTVWALDDLGASCSLTWRVNTIPAPTAPLLLSGEGYVYAGSTSGSLYEIDFRDVAAAPPIVKTLSLGDGNAAAGSAMRDDGHGLVHVGTEAGVVYAVRIPLP